MWGAVSVSANTLDMSGFFVLKWQMSRQSKVGITAQQGADRYKLTSSNPLFPGLETLSALLGDSDSYVSELWALSPVSIAILSANITGVELREALQRLRKSKTPDYSGLTATMLSNHLDGDYYNFLLTAISAHFEDPSALDANKAKCACLRKSGDYADPANCRFLSISGVFAKIPASALTRRLADAAERENLLGTHQCGFRRVAGVAESLIAGEQIKAAASDCDEESFLKTTILMADLFNFSQGLSVL